LLESKSTFYLGSILSPHQTVTSFAIDINGLKCASLGYFSTVLIKRNSNWPIDTSQSRHSDIKICLPCPVIKWKTMLEDVGFHNWVTFYRNFLGHRNPKQLIYFVEPKRALLEN